MKPLSLRLVNVGLYPELDLDFSSGVTAIVGSNGSGKSTLLDSLEVALFGDGSRDLGPMLGPHGEAMEITFVFTHDGERYRIRRRYRQGPNGSGTAWLDFERHVFSGADGPSDAPGGWATETRETAKATQAHVCRVLGLSRATFRASAFLGQGAGTVFLDALPSERKAIIGEILDARGVYPKMLERARGEANALTHDVATVATQIAEREQRLVGKGTVEGDISRLDSAQAVQQSQVLAAERGHEKALEVLSANAAAAERVRTLTVQRDHARQAAGEAREKVALAERAAADLPAAQAVVVALRESAGRVTGLELLADQAREAQAARVAALAGKEQANQHAARLAAAARGAREESSRLTEQHTAALAKYGRLSAAEDATERCDRCRQILDAEARDAALASLAAEVNIIAEQIEAQSLTFADAVALVEKAEAELAAIVIPDAPAFDTGPLEQARADAAKLPAAEHYAQTLADQAEALPALRTAAAAAALDLSEAEHERAAAAEGVADEEQLRRAVEDARAALTARRTALDATTAELVRARQQLEQLQTAEQELAGLVEDSGKLHERLDVLRLAERAYGRDGVPALIVESIVPQLEADANAFLEQLAPPHLRVEIHTQRELKTADHLRDTLEIAVLKNGERTPRPSGGEKTRAGLGLAWALAGLLRQRFGGVEMLALDEPDALDAAGMDRLAAILQGLGGSFELVLVVSHNPLLATAFDNVILVEENDGVSRIASASAQETVTV